MMNTALSAKAEQIAQSVTFRNEKHKRFFLTYLPKCRYADVYHAALVYCLGIDEDTRKNVNSIYDFETGCVKTECLHEGWITSGRLIAGKGTKEVSDEKPGVGLTRVMNTPIKKNIAAFRKQIDGLDKAMEKLDKVSEGLNSGKEAQKGARVSVKEKLSQMKTKSEQTKKEPDKQKAKSKEECL